MIGIPTPSVCPSPNFNDTCTGFAGFFGLTGLVFVGFPADVADDPVEPAAVDVTVCVVVGPTLSEPHAEASSATADSAATKVAARRIRRARGREVTPAP